MANLPFSSVSQGTPGAVLGSLLITHGFPHIAAHGTLTQETSSSTPPEVRTARFPWHAMPASLATENSQGGQESKELPGDRL